MLIIHRPQTDPYFNLATEEYLLRVAGQDCFMIWQNEPAVVVGKHQNAFAEVNHAFIYENNIPVIRRISGGGTVFHDPGNLNFSFIQKGEKRKLVDFRKFTSPVIEMLNKLGIQAAFEGKNDIRVNGLKISGNAEHVFKDKVLHHGTLLYSSGLDWLHEAIRTEENKYNHRGVQSVRSKVGNVIDFMKIKMPLCEFKSTLLDYIESKFDNIEHYQLSAGDQLKIDQLVISKYKTWLWNYAYSPDFTFKNTIQTNGILINIAMKIQKGIIVDLNLDIEPRRPEIVEFLVSLLQGGEYQYGIILEKAGNKLVSGLNIGLSLQPILKLLF
jgi:lipoate-protein ligase A